jgi:hypothetical protein
MDGYRPNMQTLSKSEQTKVLNMLVGQRHFHPKWKKDFKTQHGGLNFKPAD